MNSFGKITFLGGAGEATGSHFLFDCLGHRYAVDCGVVQGERFANEENAKAFPYDVSKLEALIITHAHMDHIGRIPKLVAQGFKGPIYSTVATKEISGATFADAVKIMTMEAQELHKEPLYTASSVTAAMAMWKTIPYHSSFTLSPEISFELKDSGHILGSAIVEFTATVAGSPKKVVFTGDLGNSPSLLLHDTEIIDDADYMLMESVYGDRNHEPAAQRDETFAKTLIETVSGGGVVIIPTFSIERTQVLLYSIEKLFESGRLPDVPVFLDSPLALKVTHIYEENTELFNDAAREAAKGHDLFNFKNLSIVRTPMESAAIHETKGPKIILAGSGMSVGGRVISHEKYYLGDPNSAILFVGYQAAGSLGRRIADGEKNVTIDNAPVTIRAKIVQIDGFSAHKDSDHLLEFVSHSQKTLKKVFVCMGELSSETFLAQKIRDNLNIDAVVPEEGSSADLI